MCEDVIQILQTMDRGELEMQLALQCSPLLAGLKLSNLLIIESDKEKAVKYLFRNSGISGKILYREKGKSVIYLYRYDELEAYLKDARIQKFMEELGYGGMSVREVLKEFARRYRKSRKDCQDFPHEMGILLGYPLEDVQGFMKNNGKNDLYSGYWKVYSNLSETLELFDQFNQAKEMMIRLLYAGVHISEMIQWKNRRIAG